MASTSATMNSMASSFSSTSSTTSTSTSTSITSTTPGMRLDALLSELDNLSNLQMYGLIVAATVLVCWVLLGTGASHSSSSHDAAAMMDYAAVKTGSNSATSGSASSSSASASASTSAASTSTSAASASVTTGRQPRWHIFKYVNVIASILFVGSVAQFALYASHYMEHGMVNFFLIGWSLFLCYFFGFFGVSLIYNDLPENNNNNNNTKNNNIINGSVENTSASTAAAATAKSATTTTMTTTTISKKTVHEPAACAPVCSDPKSFTTSITKSSKSTLPSNLKELSNDEISQLVLNNQLKDHELEKRLDAFRAVDVRRLVMTMKLQSALNTTTDPLEKLPSSPSLDYGRVHGANCEIVVGYVPLPVGLVGPLTLNNETVYVPMATTEGCLVASTNRGAKAICQGGGAFARVIRDGITRAPCVRMASAMEAADLKVWCETPQNFAKLKQAFESTTSFGKLKGCNPTVAGRNVYLRLVCFSGDAMGMNMVSKGSLAVIELLQREFPTLSLVALSGNMCTDKKAAATNWLEGRGKSVVVEANIPKSVVQSTLKTTVQAMVHTNLHKNLIGSAMAGALGGFNAHASNIVTAIFLATGQDPAQNVESSNCITLMEETPEGDLWMSCTMPSIEVGTVGGGTSLEAQAACLQAMGVKGGGNTPGENAQKLATIVAASTLAGEMSLLAALAANTLVQAHMTHNRKPTVASGGKK